MSAEKKNSSSRTNSRFLLLKKHRILLAGLLAGLIFLVVLPGVMRIYLQNWLLANGADTAIIKKIHFNPFAGKISLEGTNITINNNTVLSSADVTVDLGILSLLKKEAVVQQALLKDAVVDVEILDDGGLRVGSYTIPPSTEKKLEPTDDSSEKFSWIFTARDISLENCTVRFKMPDLDLTVQINAASLIQFTTDARGKSGTFKLTGTVNNTPVVIDLDLLKILPAITARGKVEVDGFKLTTLADLLKPTLRPFTGQASVNGKVDFKMSLDTKDIVTDYDGSITLEHGHIAGDSFSVQGAPVRWETGQIHYEMNRDKGIIIRTDGRLSGKDLAVDIPKSALSLREPDLAIEGKVLVTIDDEVAVDTAAGFSLTRTTFTMPPLAAEASNIRWQGNDRRVRFNSGTGGKGLSVEVNGQLLADNPGFTDNDKAAALDIHGTSLAWNGTVSYLPGRTKKDATRIATEGEIAGNKLILKTASVDSSAQDLSWKGKGDFMLAADSSTKLDLNGLLAGRQLGAGLPASGLTFDQESLTFKANGFMKITPDIELKGTTSLETNGLVVKKGEEQLAVLKNFAVDDIEAPGGKKITIKQANAKEIEVDINGQMPLKAIVPSIVLNNINTEDLAVFTADSLSLQNLLVTALHNGNKLAGLNNLSIKKIQAGLDQHLSVNQINLDDFYFLGKSAKDKAPVCQIAAGRLAKLDWNQKEGTHANSITLDDLNCNLVREKDGTLVLKKELAAMQLPKKQSATKKEKTVKSKNPGAAIRLDQFTLRGNSTILYQDYTLAVPFNGNMLINTLQIKNLDSGKPDKPASVKLMASMAGRAPLQVDGTIAPFADPFAMDLKLNLKNYPLVNLSSYTVQSVGVGLASGQLNMQSTIKIKDNGLNMANALDLEKLQTQTISPKLAAELDNRLPIPLDSALSVLRDANGNIKLDVPIQGKFDELNVGISDILITALGKAIVPAASGYLMYTLGPYGALAWVGVKVGEKILQVKLPPVNFAPGSDKLPDNVEDYFKRLAKILKDKPQEDFQFCPRSSAWEFMSEAERAKTSEKDLNLSKRDRKKLEELGQQRAENIRDHLVHSYAVDQDRLLICVTQIETAKSAQPRVDIHM